MTANILLPDGMRPTNLHLVPFKRDPETGLPIITKARLVTSDIYMICERVKEISERLYLVELEQTSAEGQKFGFAVMEQCLDGVDRVVCRATKDGLDGRLLEKLRRIMAVDLHTRIAIVERERESWEKAQAEEAADDLWNNVGGPMWIELEKNGFIDSRGVSYRKMNRTARRSMSAEQRARAQANRRAMPAGFKFETPGA